MPHGDARFGQGGMNARHIIDSVDYLGVVIVSMHRCRKREGRNFGLRQDQHDSALVDPLIFQADTRPKLGEHSKETMHVSIEHEDLGRESIHCFGCDQI